MTSDGIKTDDWDRVKDLACQVANASSHGDDEASARYTERLVMLLDEFQEKYGELPSILATKADYIDNTSDRLQLLRRAYELAEARQDKSNRVLIASSLAQIYVEELADLERGSVWL